MRNIILNTKERFALNVWAHNNRKKENAEY